MNYKKEIPELKYINLCPISQHEKYAKYRMKNNIDSKRSQGKGSEKRMVNTITDINIIKSRGTPCICAHGAEFIFLDLAYTRQMLCEILGINIKTLEKWILKIRRIPVTMFRAKIPRECNVKGGKKATICTWRDVYLLEEVLVMAKWVASVYKQKEHFTRSSPEFFLMNQDIEAARDEMKRRLYAGESTNWS